MAALSALEPTWPMDPSRLCRDSARRYLRDRNWAPAVAVDDAPGHVDAGPGAGVHGVLQRLHGQAGLHP